MDELPQETMCEIASYLDEYDLRGFSLISRVFVAESQHLLFRTIAFTVSSYDDTGKSRSHIVSRRPVPFD